MSQVIITSKNLIHEIKQSFLEKFNECFTPRRKRLIKIITFLFFFFILPIWIIHFGASFTRGDGGLVNTISDFTNMRIRNVSVGVYNNDGTSVSQADWHVDTDNILKALPFKIDDYILKTDPEEIRKEIINIPWVKSAKVKLQLPDHVIISLEENIPFALWQVDGNFYLIDETGDIITEENLERYDYLPWVVGQDANKYAREYVLMMQDFSDIFSIVKASYRVGDRRWTLLTHNDIEISLSEQNPRSSLERLDKLHQKYGILQKKISAIDLRVPTKVFLKRANDESMSLFLDAEDA